MNQINLPTNEDFFIFSFTGGINTHNLAKLNLDLFVEICTNFGDLLLFWKFNGRRCFYTPADGLKDLKFSIRVVDGLEQMAFSPQLDGQVMKSKEILIDRWMNFAIEIPERNFKENIQLHIQFVCIKKLEDVVTNQLGHNDLKLIEILNEASGDLVKEIFKNSILRLCLANAEALVLLLKPHNSLMLMRWFVQDDISRMVVSHKNDLRQITDPELIECMNTNIARFLKAYIRQFFSHIMEIRYLSLIKQLFISDDPNLVIDNIFEEMTNLIDHLPKHMIIHLEEAVRPYTPYPNKLTCALIICHCFAPMMIFPQYFSNFDIEQPEARRALIFILWKEIINRFVNHAGLSHHCVIPYDFENRNIGKFTYVSDKRMASFQSKIDYILSNSKDFDETENDFNFSIEPSNERKAAASAHLTRVIKSMYTRHRSKFQKESSSLHSISFLIDNHPILLKHLPKRRFDLPILEESKYHKKVNKNGCVYTGSIPFNSAKIALEFHFHRIQQNRITLPFLIQKNILKGRTYFKQISATIDNLLKIRPTLNFLIKKGTLSPNYIDILFPSSHYDGSNLTHNDSNEKNSNAGNSHQSFISDTPSSNSRKYTDSISSCLSNFDESSHSTPRGYQAYKQTYNDKYQHQNTEVTHFTNTRNPSSSQLQHTLSEALDLLSEETLKNSPIFSRNVDYNSNLEEQFMINRSELERERKARKKIETELELLKIMMRDIKKSFPN